MEGVVEAIELGVQDTPPEQDEVDEGDWETEVSATLDKFKRCCCSLEGYVLLAFISSLY